MSQVHAPHDGMPPPAWKGNRRATVRYRCAPATVGKVITAADQEYQRAWIIDLSLKGVGLQVSRPLQPGHLAIIAIRSHDGKHVHELGARVMHCEPLSQGDWFVGCELTVALTADQLEQLL